MEIRLSYAMAFLLPHYSPIVYYLQSPLRIFRQKYLFVALDNFRTIKHNENSKIVINNRLEAWLAFMCMDDPDDIVRIIEKCPDFKEMYEQIYDICRNLDG